ncbi:MAG: pilus assembly protein MshP [Gammaproteobacteria bacterium]|nr:pilus assembly protein MshP [Gammaproteobacteria bacterium]
MRAFSKVDWGRSSEKAYNQSGFTLITALFLLIVVALLSVYMINFRNVQQSTVVFGQQGARAMLAAHSGLEWGIYDSVVNGLCAPSSFTATGTALSAFTISVTCSSSAHTEGAILITTYRLTSTAQTGSYGTLDYVYRSLQATVSVQPP